MSDLLDGVPTPQEFVSEQCAALDARAHDPKALTAYMRAFDREHGNITRSPDVARVRAHYRELHARSVVPPPPQWHSFWRSRRRFFPRFHKPLIRHG